MRPSKRQPDELRPVTLERGVSLHSAITCGMCVIWIAASKSGDVAFLALLASAGMPGHELVTEQSQRILGAIGMPAAQISEAVIATQSAHRIVMTRADENDVEWELRARIAEAYLEIGRASCRERV